MKKRVFISGVTGTMGSSGLKYLLQHKEELDIVTLVRPTKKNKREMEKYQKHIKIIWGDLTVYTDVKKALIGVDYILHVAALVSPAADHNPELAYKINVGSIKNILKAINDLGLFDVKLINIGSVAETGDRLFPIHWGRVGDPLKPSIYDYYATTKILAERLVIESGLKYWVSLRQTGILHYGLLNIMEGIIFHQPLNNVLEWITEEDSGRLLANICLKNLPDNFYQNVYNIGGGESCRINNYDFMTKVLSTVGVGDIKKVYNPNWFATKNFHGQYYLDSDILNDYLNFRSESIDDFILRLNKNIGFPTSMLKILPDLFIKYFIMLPISKSKSGPLSWIKTKQTDKVDAYFGSLAQWESIKSWKDFKITDNYSQVKILDHGYDGNKPIDFNDIKKAAQFRGGGCLSKQADFKDLSTSLNWQCAFGHKFAASSRLVLKTGHWCPQCEAPPWNYFEIAKVNPFFNQVFENK